MSCEGGGGRKGEREGGIEREGGREGGRGREGRERGIKREGGREGGREKGKRGILFIDKVLYTDRYQFKVHVYLKLSDGFITGLVIYTCISVHNIIYMYIHCVYSTTK